MGLTSGATTFHVSLDAKRRPTLPAALLNAAHIQPGDDLIAVPVGDGEILLQNRTAALAAARENIRKGFKAPVAGGVVDRFLRERRADQGRADAARKDRRTNAIQTSGEADAQAAERGESLLAELGL